MILLVGASGRLGSQVANQILDEKKSIRCSSRSPEKLAEFKERGADICQADLRDSESLVKACKGAKTVIVAAHSLLGRGKEQSKFVDYQGHINLIDIAKKANVEHFIYISINFDDPDIHVPFIQYKYKVEEYLRSSGINYSIIKPSAFIEEHAHQLIGVPLIERGKVTLFGKGESPINYVAVEDVAKLVLIALSNPTLLNKTIKVGGPSNLTANQVTLLYEKVIGKKIKVSHIPRFMMKIMSPLLRPFHQGLSQVIAFSLYLDKNGSQFEISENLKKYPLDLISLEKWIEKHQIQMNN